MERYKGKLTTVTGTAPTAVTVTGKGKLTVNAKKLCDEAIDIDGWVYGENETYDAVEEVVRYQSVSIGSKVSFTATKNVKLALTAYGVDDAIGIYGTTISKAGKAISIKGKYKTKFAKKSQKNVPTTNSRDGYKDSEYVELASDGNWYDDYASLPEGVTWTGKGGTVYSFNGGTVWGKVALDSPYYKDKTTRQRYYSTWDMFTKDASGRYNLVATVGNNQELPQGYTLDRYDGYQTPIEGTTYTHVVSDSKVTPSK